MTIRTNREIDEAFESVAKRGWMSDMDIGHRELFKSIAVLRNVEEGKEVIAFGEEATGMCGIVTGSLALETIRPSQDSFLAYRPGPGFWVGHYAVLTGRPHLMACRAAEPSKLIWLARNPLLRLLEENPALHKDFSELTYRHMRNVLDVLGRITAENSIARISGRLLLEYRGRCDEDGWVSITQPQLAEMLSASLPTLQRTLAKLATEKLIEIHYGRIKIVEPARLEELAAFSKL